MSPKAQLGILGGTFNPIHLGHLRAAEEVAEAFGLRRVLFVPSAVPPHKGDAAEAAIAPAALRLDWVRRAIADNPRFEADPLELEREGPSYSVDTLLAIGARLAPELPVFAIGCDAFAELGTWREPEKVLALTHFAVMTRPPATRASLEQWLPRCARTDLSLASDGRSARHRSAPAWVRVVEISALDISSSDIRSRIRRGRSVRYLVPEAVREDVERCAAYA